MIMCIFYLIITKGRECIESVGWRQRRGVENCYGDLSKRRYEAGLWRQSRNWVVGSIGVKGQLWVAHEEHCEKWNTHQLCKPYFDIFNANLNYNAYFCHLLHRLWWMCLIFCSCLRIIIMGIKYFTLLCYCVALELFILI